MAEADTLILAIDPELRERLTTLAARSGRTVDELARAILASHAGEHALAEYEEDERRWRLYEETGEAVPVEEFRARLRAMAEEARNAQ